MDRIIENKIRAAIQKVFFQREHGVPDIEIDEKSVIFETDDYFFLSIFHNRVTLEDTGYSFPLLDKIVQIMPSGDKIANALQSLQITGERIKENGIDLDIDYLSDTIDEEIVYESLHEIFPLLRYSDGLAKIRGQWHCTAEEVEVIKWIASFLQPSELLDDEELWTEEDF